MSFEPLDWQPRHSRILLAILLLAFGLRAFLLGFPEGKFFDEIYYVDAAFDYLSDRADSNNVHPPAAKIQLAAAILAFDMTKLWGWHHFDDVIGWRLLPVLCGVGTVGLTAWLGLILTKRPPVALAAAAMVAIDHLSIAESRICTLDGIQTFWITLGVTCAACRLFVSAENRWLVFSALALAVSTACKWNGLFPTGAVVLAFWGLVSGPMPRPSRMLVLVTYVAATVVIYTLSYWPYARLYPEKSTQQIVTEVKAQHKRMIDFRNDPKQFRHTYLSPFFQWPLVVRPVWFHYQKHGQDTCTGIVALGTVPFWWLAIFLLLEKVVSAWRGWGPQAVDQFLVVTYFPQWLLWASSITGGFFYYLLPVVPLMALTVAVELQLWWAQGRRRWVLTYLAVLGILTLLYYPFMSGLCVPNRYFQTLFFFPRWI
jgi:dolichyl-phosphate-mannose-protein mannosyltransferase